MGALSQGTAGGLPGLTLRAWARVSSAGVLLKGVGVASVARPVTGIYTVNLSVPVAVDGTVRVLPLTQPVSTGECPIGSAATVSLYGSAGGATANGDFYVEIYE